MSYQKPVIKNFKDNANPMLGSEDGASTYVMLYVQHAPGESTPDHVHPWEHQAFITEGAGVLVCDGREYTIKAGDAVQLTDGTKVRVEFLEGTDGLGVTDIQTSGARLMCDASLKAGWQFGGECLQIIRLGAVKD